MGASRSYATLHGIVFRFCASDIVMVATRLALLPRTRGTVAPVRGHRRVMQRDFNDEGKGTGYDIEEQEK
jgi:hypothetical protein